MESVRGALNDATGFADWLKLKDLWRKNTPDFTFLSSQSLSKVSTMISNHYSIMCWGIYTTLWVIDSNNYCNKVESQAKSCSQAAIITLIDMEWKEVVMDATGKHCQFVYKPILLKLLKQQKYVQKNTYTFPHNSKKNIFMHGKKNAVF